MLNPAHRPVGLTRRAATTTLAGIVLAGMAACGGGGSGDDRDARPAPQPAAQPLALLDSMPRDGMTLADPSLGDVTFAHLGFADLAVSYEGPCAPGRTVRRTLTDLSEQGFDQLLEHRLACTGLVENETYAPRVTGERADGSAYQAELTFSTGPVGNPEVNVLDTLTSPRDTVALAFTDYATSVLLPELDLAAPVETLILGTVFDLFADWTNLTAPEALHGVVAQRVSYASRDPAGGASDALTGLVAAPDAGSDFTPREQVIVLSHSTGSTPGDLDLTNGWYLTASLLAARGYLVIAADNWGRGGTAAEPETYLLASRTAANTLDLVRRVLADPDYDQFRASGDAAELVIIGYSQGGHSALALWEAIATLALDEIVVSEVYAGGAPYDLYQTLAGILRGLDGSCDNGPYCRYVDEETILPFLTDRTLPGLLDYTATGLTRADVLDGDRVAAAFVSGFLGNEPVYDNLKALLQLGSFTNLVDPAGTYDGSSARLVLYHSPFDRLVPAANTDDLKTLLIPHRTLDDRSAVCATVDYETIFNLTDVVGIVHALCGLAMLDDVVGELR